MRILFVAAPALLFAGIAVAQGDGRPNPGDPKSRVPPVEFRSAFEGYRPFADQEPGDWRKANEQAGAGGGHAGHSRPKEAEKSPPKAPAHGGRK
jgi:hypothetical protein